VFQILLLYLCAKGPKSSDSIETLVLYTVPYSLYGTKEPQYLTVVQKNDSVAEVYNNLHTSEKNCTKMLKISNANVVDFCKTIRDFESNLLAQSED
jgi:hypothetical protein